MQVDTDVLVYPERLLRLLRTIEAAVGTQQWVSLGHMIQCIPLLGGRDMSCVAGAAGLQRNATPLQKLSCGVRAVWNGMCAGAGATSPARRFARHSLYVVPLWARREALCLALQMIGRDPPPPISRLETSFPVSPPSPPPPSSSPLTPTHTR